MVNPDTTLYRLSLNFLQLPLFLFSSGLHSFFFFLINKRYTETPKTQIGREEMYKSMLLFASGPVVSEALISMGLTTPEACHSPPGSISQFCPQNLLPLLLRSQLPGNPGAVFALEPLVLLIISD